MKTYLIVGYEKETGAIGYKGGLYYSLPNDMRNFRQITTETKFIDRKNLVVMGRKTWDSLSKKPLPYRINLVFSSQSIEGVDTVSNFDDYLEYIIKHSFAIENVFVIGGSQLYGEFLKRGIVDEVLATVYTRQTDIVYPADTYFPMEFLRGFSKISTRFLQLDHHFEANYVVYRKKVKTE